MPSHKEIRVLFKVFAQNPEFFNKVRSAETPAKKHEIIEAAGYKPVHYKELREELARALQGKRSGHGHDGDADTVSDEEFLENNDFVQNVMQLASGTASDDA